MGCYTVGCRTHSKSMTVAWCCVANVCYVVWEARGGIKNGCVAPHSQWPAWGNVCFLSHDSGLKALLPRARGISLGKAARFLLILSYASCPGTSISLAGESRGRNNFPCGGNDPDNQGKAGCSRTLWAKGDACGIKATHWGISWHSLAQFLW